MVGLGALFKGKCHTHYESMVSAKNRSGLGADLNTSVRRPINVMENKRFA
jgi:hypothetical protein